MINMDELERELVRFQQALKRFNETLRSSHDDLRRHHERVDPLWKDTFRKEYDRRWESFSGPVKKYVDHHGREYERIVENRLQHTRRYQHGG